MRRISRFFPLALACALLSPSAPAGEPTGVTRDQLAKAPRGEWFAIDTRDLQGSLVHFDVEANYAWLNAWGKAFADDAQLERISLDHLPALGMPFNLQTDAQAELDVRWFSPALIAAQEKLSQVSEVEVPSGFRISCEEGKCEAMISRPVITGDNPPTPASLGCGTVEILKAAEAAGKLEKKPFHDIWLRGWRGKWTWSMDDAFVDAQTCQVVP